MTVADLIAKLTACPQDQPVVIYVGSAEDGWHTVEDVWPELDDHTKVEMTLIEAS